MKTSRHSNLNIERDNFIAKIKKLGLRITNQRQQLIDSIIKHKKPFSAEGIFKSSKTTKNKIDLAIVYRTLTSFSSKEIISTVCVAKSQEKIIEQMGYSSVSHKLEFFGVCKQCSKTCQIDY